MALSDKQQANVSAFVTSSLEPGEQIVAVLGLAITGPSLWIAAFISTWLTFLQKRWAIVVTDRRVLVVELKMTMTGYPPKALAGAYPKASVKGTFSHGTITGKLVLTGAGVQPLALQIPRIYQDFAEQVAGALA